MKTLKMAFAVSLFITASGLSSCRKQCNGPHEHKGKHDCSHHHDTGSAPTTTVASSGT